MKLSVFSKLIKYLVFVGAASVINLAFSFSFFSEGLPELLTYKIDRSQTSVSGLSSGAFMATQFHVAFSQSLIGVGIIAGGPYYCAGAVANIPFVETAMTLCMNPLLNSAPDATELIQQAKKFEQSGDIDHLDNLKKSKVYLFSGKADATVVTKVVDQTLAFYKLAGVPEQNIKYIKNVNAGHSIITDNLNNSDCAITTPPFINNCHFIQSHDILRQIYGELKPPSSQLSGKLMKFNQKKYVHAYFSSMSDEAYLYAPKSCETETCKIHVVFHGCEQGARKIGDLFYRTTGYNEIADSNHIIVLYPQVERSAGIFPPYNPKGCWDFWGYTNIGIFAPDFYSKHGTQMAAVKAMLDKLAK